MGTVWVRVGLTSGVRVGMELTPEEVDDLAWWLSTGSTAVRRFGSVYLVRRQVAFFTRGEVEDDG